MQETERGIELHGLPGPTGSLQVQHITCPDRGEPSPDIPAEQRSVSPIASVKPAVLTARYTEAVEYARAHHVDDVRKGTAIPHIAHVLAVSALVLEHGGNETAACTPPDGPPRSSRELLARLDKTGLLVF